MRKSGQRKIRSLRTNQNGRKFIMKSIFFITLIFVFTGCLATLKPAPEGDQCQYNGTPRAFYCENTGTGEKLKYPADHSYLKAAQCFPADYYKQIEDYMDYLYQEAQKKCSFSK